MLASKGIAANKLFTLSVRTSCFCLLYTAPLGFLTSFHRLNIKITNKEFNPIEELINFMKSNLEKNLTLKEFAEHVNMSPSHLSAVFKKKTKYSPVNLFTNLKIQKASQLLLDEQYSIKTIAFNLGFEDPYHFSRIFKRVMGVSPKYFKADTSGL